MTTPELDPSAPALAEDELAQIKADLEAEPVDHVARNPLEAQLFRYVRRRTSLEAERARLKNGMERMIAEIDARIRGLDFVYGSTCEATVRAMLTGKSRSIKTPYGTAGFRKKPARVVVTQLDAVVKAWEMGELPREAVKQDTVVTTSPVMQILSDLYTKTGEIPPGCDLVPERDDFYVK